MSSHLNDLLAKLQSNAGVTPQVNPPEAAAVLETQTAPETDGKPEPEPPAPEPVEAAHETVDANGARLPPKKRRTASVVQAELDEAFARIAELEKGVGDHESPSQTEYDKSREQAEKQIRALTETIKQLEEQNKNLHEACGEAAVKINELQGELKVGGRTAISEISMPMVKTEDLVEELKGRGYARVILES